jgi:sirohydrochlorin cobaltochelatase
MTSSLDQQAPKAGLILFGHGARDPRWAEPMERLQARLAATVPDIPVELAFLELLEPSLPSAAARLLATGCDRLVIVPIFLGQGGHVRRDLAALAQSVRDAHPGVDVRCAMAVGEDDAVLDALAAYCLKTLDPGLSRPRE